MGNFPNQESSVQNQNPNKKFIEKIDKVSSGYLQKFGQFSVYQLNQKPYDYYIEYIQNIVPNYQLVSQKIKFYKNLPKNKNLVSVEYIETFKKKQLCAVFDGLRIFCLYYNFTLQDAIKLKIKQKSIFTQAQILYILKSLLSIGKFYQNQLKSNFYSGIYKTKNVFLSPEGHIKIYPFNENVFSAYLQKIQHDQQSYSPIDNKKVSLQNDDKIKPFAQTRDQSSIFKSGMMSKSRQIGSKKAKLTTTLKKYQLNPLQSQQLLKLKGVESHQISRHQSNSLLSHQQSSQTISFLFNKLSENKSTNKRDLFQLGLLMMQIILLNQESQYYKEKSMNSSLSTNNKDSFVQLKQQSRNTNNLRNTLNSTFDNFKNDLQIQNLKRIQEYQSQNGKVPNIDLICFSVTKLLPKKGISKFLITLIQKMIIGCDDQSLQYQEMHDLVQRQHEICKQAKYCIKFQQVRNKSPSQGGNMMKNKSINTLNKTVDFSKTNDFKNLNYEYKVNTQNNRVSQISNGVLSKNFNEKFMKLQVTQQNQQFSPTKKLQDLMKYNNLSKSVIFDEEINLLNTTQILDHLKKSRKLIPSKIRSISTRTNEQKKQ